jgi:hypothetical protein
VKKLTVFHILSVLSIVFVTLAAAYLAYADEPDQTKITLDSWYTKGPSPDGPCTFTIDVHVVGNILDQKRYGEDGNLVQEKYIYGGNRYYLYANDKTVTVQNSGTTVITYVSPTQIETTLNGQEWVWTIPGYGTVSGEIGKQAWSSTYDEEGNLLDVTVQKLVGNMMQNDVTPLICEYLGP